MTIATLFSRRDEADEAGLAYAAKLAQKLDRRLRVVLAVPDAASVWAYSAPEFAIGVSTVISKEIIASQERLVAETRKAFERIISETGKGLAADFEVRDGFVGPVAADEALLADAFVFPREATRAGHVFSGALEHILMDACQPLLVASSSGSLDGPVIIAWDGSDEAGRAVRHFMPLLAGLGEVVIAQNGKDLGSRSRRAAASPEALQSWLKARGVDSETAGVNGDVGEGLLTLAANIKASAIVSGAYGHSRAGEFLFGGVTRTLLRAEDCPALAICH